jgi:uridine phosphorylase
LPFQIKNYEYPHQCKKGEIAKVVLQPGDPLRAKYIAENFLEDAKLVSQTRGILYYTGYIKGKKSLWEQAEWAFQASEFTLLNFLQSMM